MATSPASEVLRFLRERVSAEEVRTLPDRELLHRFTAQRDEAAFEALVCRHGPLVLGVCRQLLGNWHDAEDAFQATFLVLSRKASSLRHQGSVASWLYGVASRLSQKLRTSAARRQARERRTEPHPAGDPLDEITVREARELLHAELARLPDRYRAPLLLCHLEGLTRDEAAERLGWRLATVKSRLEQARALLRRRLTARGLTISGTLVASLLGTQTASAVPTTLAQRIARAAGTMAGAAIENVSSRSIILMKGELRAMSWIQVQRIAPALLAAAGLVWIGAGLLSAALGQPERPDSVQIQAASAGAKPAVPNQAVTAQEKAELQQVQGTWHIVAFELDGKKVGQDLVEAVGARWEIKGDRVTETSQGKKRQSKVRLDPAREPKQITLTVESGDAQFPGGTNKGQTMSGIYRLKGEELTVCLNAKDGQELPRDFTTKAGDTWALFVLKRAKPVQDPAKPKPAVDLPGELEVGKNKLRNIGIALFGYADAKGRLPAPAIYNKDGKPLLSWRVAVLPYLDESYKGLYAEFKLDEPWDSEHNKKLLPKMPHFYASPSVLHTPAPPHHTFHQVFTGQGTAFPGKEGLKPQQIKDLTATVLIVEAGEAVPWTKPQDLPYDSTRPVPKLGGPFQTGYHALVGYYNVYFNKKGFDEKALRSEIEIDFDPNP